MQIEAGRWYWTREGLIAWVEGRYTHPSVYPFYGHHLLEDEGVYRTLEAWTEEGKVFSSSEEHSCDLICESASRERIVFPHPSTCPRWYDEAKASQDALFQEQQEKQRASFQEAMRYKSVREWLEKICSARFDGQIRGEGIYLTRCGLAAWVIKKSDESENSLWEALQTYPFKDSVLGHERITAFKSYYSKKGGDASVGRRIEDDITHNLCSRPFFPSVLNSDIFEFLDQALGFYGQTETNQSRMFKDLLGLPYRALEGMKRASQWASWLGKQREFQWRKEAMRHKEESEEVLFT